MLQRDEWMSFDFLALKTSSTAERRAEKERQKEEERAKAQAIEQVCFLLLFGSSRRSCVIVNMQKWF